jgi:hypothetical protein
MFMTITVTSSIERPRSSLDNYAHARSTASSIYLEHKILEQMKTHILVFSN